MKKITLLIAMLCMAIFSYSQVKLVGGAEFMNGSNYFGLKYTGSTKYIYTLPLTNTNGVLLNTGGTLTWGTTMGFDTTTFLATPHIWSRWNTYSVGLKIGAIADSCSVVPNAGTGMTISKGSGINLSSLALTNHLATINKDLSVGRNLAVTGDYNSTGYINTKIGTGVLDLVTSGAFNSGLGATALYSNTSGWYNNAFGFEALLHNTTGYSNTAIGTDALKLLTTGHNNTSLGDSAGYSNTTGSGNIYLGNKVGQYHTGSNMLFIGNGLNVINSATSRTLTPIVATMTGVQATQQITINGNDSTNGSLAVTRTSSLTGKLMANNRYNTFGTLNTDTNDFKGRIGVNSLHFWSLLSVISTTTTNGLNMFNFVDGRFNKNRTSYAQAIDTSSFNFSFTPLGKPLLNIKGVDGLNKFNLDSIGDVSVTAGGRIGFGSMTNLIKESGTELQIWSGATIRFYIGGTQGTISAAQWGITPPLLCQGSISFEGTTAHTFGISNAINTSAGANLTTYAGSNTAGGTADLNGGINTSNPGVSKGTGLASVRIGRNSRAKSTATTLNTISDAFIIPSTKILTDSVATSIFTLTPLVADTTAYGQSVAGTFNYQISTKGTNGTQTQAGKITFTAEEYGGVIVSNIVQDITNSSLTATTTFSIVPTITYATGTWTVKIQTLSSLTSAGTHYIKLDYILEKNNATYTQL